MIITIKVKKSIRVRATVQPMEDIHDNQNNNNKEINRSIVTVLLIVCIMQTLHKYINLRKEEL